MLVGDVGGRVDPGGLTSTATTDAAAVAAPPEPQGIGLAVVAGAIFAAVSLLPTYVIVFNLQVPPADKAKWSGLALAIGVVTVATCVWEYRRHRRFNATVYAPALARWRRTWACRRCGAAFVPAA